MSYKAQPRVNKRATMFYPNVLKVYEYKNPFTQKMEPVFQKTKPYRKDFQGETKREIDEYLAHVVDDYGKKRDDFVKNGGYQSKSMV